VGALSLSVHPTLGLYAVTGPTGLEIRDTNSNETRHIDIGAWVSKARWHKSSSRIAATFGRKVLARDALSTKKWESTQYDATLQDLAWLPGGGVVASTGYGGVNLNTPFLKTESKTLEFMGSLLCVVISPNARWVVTGSQDNTLQVFSPKDDVRLEMRGYMRKINELAFNANGGRLANNGSPEVTVWDFSGVGPKGRKPLQLPGHDPTATRLRWHPHFETVLATSDNTGVIRLFDVAASQTTPTHSLKPGSGARINVLEWLTPRSICYADSGGEFGVIDL
jgi:WD40 repeat protein